MAKFLSIPDAPAVDGIVPPFEPDSQKAALTIANWLIKFMRNVDLGHPGEVQYAQEHGLRVGEPFPETFTIPQYRHEEGNRKEGSFVFGSREVFVSWQHLFSFFKDDVQSSADPDSCLVTHNGVKDPLLANGFVYSIVFCWRGPPVYTVGVRSGANGVKKSIQLIRDYVNHRPNKTYAKGMRNQLKEIYTQGSFSAGHQGHPQQEQNAHLASVDPSGLQRTSEEEDQKSRRFAGIVALAETPGLEVGADSGASSSGILRPQEEVHVVAGPANNLDVRAAWAPSSGHVLRNMNVDTDDAQYVINQAEGVVEVHAVAGHAQVERRFPIPENFAFDGSMTDVELLEREDEDELRRREKLAEDELRSQEELAGEGRADTESHAMLRDDRRLGKGARGAWSDAPSQSSHTTWWRTEVPSNATWWRTEPWRSQTTQENNDEWSGWQWSDH